MPEINIAASFKDGGMLRGLKDLRTVTKGFKGDLEGTSKKLEELSRQKIDIESKLNGARKAAKDFNNVIKQTKGAFGEGFLKDALKETHEYEAALQSVNAEIKNTQKEMRGLVSEENKRGNRSGGGFFDSTVSGMIKKQAFDMITDVMQQGATYVISSAFDSETANVLGGAVSSAISGAIAGTAIAGPGIGTAIGAGIGVLSGAASGAIQNEQTKDEDFKSTVSDKYSEIKQAQSEFLTRGSKTAGQREIDKIAFDTLLGEKSGEYLKWLKKTAAETPFSYSNMISMSKTLATYGYAAEEMRDMLIKIGDTGATLGLDENGMSMLVTGLGRMKVTNKTNAEYLNLLLERGVNVYKYLSEGFGISEDQIIKELQSGKLSGAKAAEILIEKMGEANAGAMEKMSHAFDGLTNTMEDFWENVEAAQGDAYNKARQASMENTVNWMDQNQESMEKMYSAIGTLEAQLQNVFDKELYKKYEDIMNSEAGKIVAAIPEGATELTEEQMNAAREVQTRIATAKAEAEAEYMKTEGFEMRQQTEKDIISSLQEAVLPVWYQYGYNLQLEINKGRMAAGMDNPGSTGNPFIEAEKTGKGTVLGVPITPVKKKKGAYGFLSVPYDNYPTLLHQGERVLTASEARRYDGGKGIVITGNTFTVREEADISRIAGELLRGIKAAKEGYAYA